MSPGPPVRELPEGPFNAALLEFLRGRGARPHGVNDMALGGWQLHTHPDLESRLTELAPGQPLYAAYGVPLLARGEVAAAVAMGTSTLLVRLPRPPTDLEAGDPLPPLTDQGWYSVSPWQTGLPSAEGLRRLSGLVRGALEHAADLASSQGAKSTRGFGAPAESPADSPGTADAPATRNAPDAPDASGKVKPRGARSPRRAHRPSGDRRRRGG